MLFLVCVLIADTEFHAFKLNLDSSISQDSIKAEEVLRCLVVAPAGKWHYGAMEHDDSHPVICHSLPRILSDVTELDRTCPVMRYRLATGELSCFLVMTAIELAFSSYGMRSKMKRASSQRKSFYTC